MPQYSDKSQKLLLQCHDDLQIVFNFAIKIHDITILDTTIRTIEQQREFVRTGKSWTMDSKHLICEKREKSDAVDFTPYPVNWNDRERFAYVAGTIIGIAEYLYSIGVIKSRFRWGGDWNMNSETKDEKHSDMPHIERIAG